MTDQERLFLAAAVAEGGMPVSAGGPPFRASEADPARTQVRPAFDPNAPIDPAPTVAPDTLPVSVPGYEVIEELGSGTMGVVYKARETALKRLVALKLMRGNAHPDAVARFLIEAEAVAAIDHPRVVRIYQYGEHNGRPFLAMEYLPGGTLKNRFGGRAFPPREAAVLVAKLATGVGAAHALGIVHRDLKPGNVLFDIAGEPKVADFGLARRGAGNDQTRTDATMGTPPYMPPEQFGGAKYAGPPADVWALGVILYECLTGTRPFLGENQDELRDQIDRGNPAPPSRVAPEVPRDLELICLKCLAKAPPDRYPTAAVLADDLNRFLEWKPVSVRTFRWSERAVLRARRNPVVAVLLAVVVISLVIGATVSYLNYRDARKQEGIALAKAEDAEREAREAKRQEEIAIGQRKQAEAARDYTLDVLDTMTSKITGDSLATQKVITPEQKKFLAEILTAYKKFAGEKGDDGLSRKRIAGAAFRVGVIEYRLGRKEQSAIAIRQACDGYAALVADFPAASEYRAGLAWSHNNLGVLLADGGEWVQAEEQLRKALAILGRLTTDFPTVREYRVDLASSHGNLGYLFDYLSNRVPRKRMEAAAEYRKALEMFEKLAVDFPTVPEYRVKQARSHNNLGALFELVETEEAEHQFRKALAIKEKLATDFPTVLEYRVDLGESHHNLGSVLYRLRKPKEAEEEYRQAVTLFKNLADRFPSIPKYRENLARSHNGLGVILKLDKKKEQQKQAEVQFREALAIWKKLSEEFPNAPDYRSALAGSHFNLRNLLNDLGERSEAEEHLHQALAICDKLIDDFRDLTEFRQGAGFSLSGFAALYAVGSGQVTNKKKEYADRAMDLLQKAVIAGYKDAEEMAKDPDFEPIRDRADFKLLLETLSKPK